MVQYILHYHDSWFYHVPSKSKKGEYREVGWSEKQQAHHCNCIDFSWNKKYKNKCRHILIVEYFRNWEPWNIIWVIQKIKKLDGSVYWIS